MAFVFQRRLAGPLWAIAFFTVAPAALPTATLFLMPRTTAFAIAAVGIAAIVFSMPGRSRGGARLAQTVRVLPSGHRDPASVALTMTAGTGERTRTEPNRSAANDALERSRMDDDGGWEMARPQA